MDILQDLEIENDFVANVQQDIAARGCQRRYKTRTCAVFFEEMSDFEFERTFRFSKDGVHHLTALLGNKNAGSFSD